MFRYEKQAVKRFQHVIAVSELDRDLMATMSGARHISVVPTGVDLKEYSAIANHEENHAVGPRVLFLGSMDWEANIDGVDYFCRDIWPTVKSAVPDARFCVVGRNPPSRIRKWADESIEVTGRVESVLPYLRDSSVFVVPLRIGGGTRLKIYEAMAAGKAVISTSVGSEGLEVHDGKDILLADTKEQFAKAVIDVLKDKQLRQSLGSEAARLAARYDWTIVAQRFEEILAMVAETPSADRRSAPNLTPVNA